MIYPVDLEQKLGFAQLRENLQHYCLCQLGIDQLGQLSFSHDVSVVKRQLNQTFEFKSIIEKAEPFPSANYFDPTALFSIIAIDGSFVESEDFLAIGLSLQTIKSAHDFLSKNSEIYPYLFQLANLVAFPASLINSIHGKIDETGKVKDNASVELSRLRRRIREEEGRVRRMMDQVFRQAAASGWVPEGVSPTIREGRVVIPILAEHKRKLRGFIMDESSTGQTIYLEPAEVLEANNEIRDLLHAERREVIKILRDLTSLLRAHLDTIKPAYQFLGQLDFIRAKAKLAIDLDALLPTISAEPDLNWLHARHPLLFLSLKGKRNLVPLTIDITSQNRWLLVSGPNAGGKSVCLKTVGLIQYMAQCGLLVPLHEKSTVGIFKNIFLDIGDQQSIENDLSTYSSHLKNMAYFIQYATPKTLILLDELGAGTDPNFGGGIAQAVLETLLKKSTWGVATTHYYNLKLFVENNQGIKNAAMVFDSKKLEPLFQLEIGKPGSSFALEIARKTGLPQHTLASAENIIGKDITGLETLMKSVAEDKQQVAKKQLELKQQEVSLSQLQAKYEKLSSELDLKKKEIINKAREEASYLLKETNREIEKTIRHIQENKAEQKETRKVRKGLQTLTERVQPNQDLPKVVSNEVIKEGDKVRIIGQEVTGDVLSIKDKTAVVQFGGLRSTLKLAQLVRSDLAISNPTITRARSMGIDIHRKQSQFASSLDIRGKRVEEAIPMLDQFLDDAILLGQAELNILHGKGEGILRQVIREKLKSTKAVASFTDAHADRGGAGITVVVLK
jgi:DNA mismatch repair protein MutS2